MASSSARSEEEPPSSSLNPLLTNTSPQQAPPLTSFVFSPDVAAEMEKDLELRVSALEVRVDKLINAVRFNEHPIINQILMVSRNPEEIERLGKALQRIGPILGELDDLKMKRKTIEFARKNPHWFGAAFGVFNADGIDTYMRDIKSS